MNQTLLLSAFNSVVGRIEIRYEDSFEILKQSDHPLFTQIGEPSLLWIDKDTFQISAIA